MFGLRRKAPKTHYDVELAKQVSDRLSRSKVRLSELLGRLDRGETCCPITTCLEVVDLINYIESNSKQGDLKLGLVLSDCHVLRLCAKLGTSKFKIETIEGWD